MVRVTDVFIDDIGSHRISEGEQHNVTGNCKSSGERGRKKHDDLEK
jgi:hypothetical protein